MRASHPQGRVGPDIPALIEALPMYRRKVREKLTGKAAFAGSSRIKPRSATN